MVDAGSISNADTDLPFGIQDLLPLILKILIFEVRAIDQSAVSNDTAAKIPGLNAAWTLPLIPFDKN